jgi:hypothetical protein
LGVTHSYCQDFDDLLSGQRLLALEGIKSGPFADRDLLWDANQVYPGLRRSRQSAPGALLELRKGYFDRLVYSFSPRSNYIANENENTGLRSL